MSPAVPTSFRWLRTGAEGFTAMIEAIDAARHSVRLETYIFSNCPVGLRIREALLRARLRGIAVQVLVDSFGSFTLPDSFWTPLRNLGGRVNWFNPLSLRRWAYRNHRKSLVVDETTAFVGGFNIAQEYDGDGVTQGWRDLGLQVTGGLAAELAKSFDRVFSLADFRHKRLQRLRKARNRITSGANWKLLSSGPGCRHGQIKRVLAQDLSRAQWVRIASGYFLPTWRLRRELRRVVKRGGRVQLMLAGKSDVALAQLASRWLYRLFLRGGVEIWEYQPQVLHAKMFIVDEAVYVGSANLDARSLGINYELHVRVTDPQLATGARALFDADLQHCHRIDRAAWRKSRGFWSKLKERWAYFILAQLDPLLARMQLKALR